MVNRPLKYETQASSSAQEEGAAQVTPLNPLLLPVTKEQQEELVSIIQQDFDNAEEARKKTDWGTDKYGKGIDFDTKYANLIALYEGEDEVRPEKWMCGRSLKIAQSIVELLVARLYPAIWNENSVRWKPVEATDKVTVGQINKLMKWVIRTWMKMDKSVMLFARAAIMLGTVWVETYWSESKKDLDETQDLPVMGEDGQPIVGEDGKPLTIESRLLRVDEKPALKIIPITRVYTQPGCTDIQKEPLIKVEEFYYHELEGMQAAGLMQNVTDKLKNEVDSYLKQKFGEELEKAEKIADANAKRRAHPVEVIVWYGPYDLNGDGFAEEICVLRTLKEKIFLRAVKVSKLSKRGKRPFVKTNFLDRIHKLLGIGVLEQVRPLAEEIDACFRQLQDANTLSIMRWGFYDPNSDYDPDEHVAKPRAMYPVTNPQQNVYFPDISIPVERLLNAIRLVLEFVERLTAASSYALGKESEIVGGSGTATRVQEISSSANIRFNLPATNLRLGLAEILMNIFELCTMNMPQGLEKRILGEDSTPIFDSYEAMQDAFLTEMDVYIGASADQGDIDVQRELSIILYDKFVLGGNPLVTGDINRLWYASANVLKSYGEEPADWLGKPQTSKETNDPVVEHTIMREGRAIHAEPQENHLEHILIHMRELNGPNILLWPPEAVELLRKHIEEHKQLMQMVMNFQNSQKKGGEFGQRGGKTQGAGGASSAPGELPVSSNANPASGAAENQIQGTTLGTPAIR